MWPFSRKGPSGFSWSSTAEEVTQGIDGTGLTAIITGFLFFNVFFRNNNLKIDKWFFFFFSFLM